MPERMTEHNCIRPDCDICRDVYFLAAISAKVHPTERDYLNGLYTQMACATDDVADANRKRSDAEQAAFARGAERQREADANEAHSFNAFTGAAYCDPGRPGYGATKEHDYGRGGCYVRNAIAAAIRATPLVTEE